MSREATLVTALIIVIPWMRAVADELVVSVRGMSPAAAPGLAVVVQIDFKNEGQKAVEVYDLERDLYWLKHSWSWRCGGKEATQNDVDLGPVQ
jgi:hypothetical protein